MGYSPAVVERAMNIQEVLLRAMSGTLSWMQAAEILGWSERTVRRWRFRYPHYGYDGLWDRGKDRSPPCPRREGGRADLAAVSAAGLDALDCQVGDRLGGQCPTPGPSQRSDDHYPRRPPCAWAGCVGVVSAYSSLRDSPNEGDVK